jgi:hypothetical protein
MLLHGDDELETGWDCSWITLEQAKRLLDLLVDGGADVPGHDLVRELRRRTGSLS